MAHHNYRSGSRGSSNIRERARSFERGNQRDLTGGGSLPGSRRGSFSGSRSASAMAVGSSAAKMDRFWQQTLDSGGVEDRPPSRTDHDVRRWQSVGRLDTSEWEDKIRYVYSMSV